MINNTCLSSICYNLFRASQKLCRASKNHELLARHGKLVLKIMSVPVSGIFSPGPSSSFPLLSLLAPLSLKCPPSPPLFPILLFFIFFFLGHSNLITCLTSFFWKKKSCQTPKKKEKKSYLWCLTDESGFEIFNYRKLSLL